MSNIQTFIDNEKNDVKIPENLINLMTFTTYSTTERNCDLILSSFNIKLENGKYIFKFKNKSYSFSVFSDWNLQKYDKRLLIDDNKRTNLNTLRTLKLACSMDIINPKVAIGNSLTGILDTIIIFQEKGIEKVIDYSKNLVMKKEDYYELFEFKEKNIVDKFELYIIYFIMSKTGSFCNIHEYLIFTKEIFKDLSKQKFFEFLNRKYDKYGINIKNNVLIGNEFDCLFFQKEDYLNTEFERLREIIDDFTKSPDEENEYVCYDKRKNKYILSDVNFGSIEFQLLSDVIDDQKKVDNLLSEKRYNKCHDNSLLVASILNQKCDSEVFVVGGKIKSNETDYFYHSWVEYENIVIDYNHNLIIDKNTYYKLYGAVSISRTLFIDIIESVNISLYAGFDLYVMYVNYFGTELKRDLKKNKSLLRKKEPI